MDSTVRRENGEGLHLRHSGARHRDEGLTMGGENKEVGEGRENTMEERVGR